MIERDQGFMVLADPRLPTLEQLWSGQSTLDIYGPANELLTCRMDFFSDSEGTQRVSQWAGSSARLPITNDEWVHFLDRAKRTPAMRAAYDECASCTVSFRSVVLGEYALHCEREFVPFRWKVKRSKGAYHLGLIQNDSTEALTAFRYTFEAPDKYQQLQINADRSVPVSNDGGLYEAIRGNSSTALVLAPFQINSLADLKPKVSRIAVVHSAEELIELASAIKRWTEELGLRGM